MKRISSLQSLSPVSGRMGCLPGSTLTFVGSSAWSLIGLYDGAIAGKGCVLLDSLSVFELVFLRPASMFHVPWRTCVEHFDIPEFFFFFFWPAVAVVGGILKIKIACRKAASC